jgi:hypothetical protein
MISNAQHQSEYKGETWVVFDTTDDHTELEGETGKEFTATRDVTVRAKATGGGTRESTGRTGRRSGNTPPNQTGRNEEDIDPVLLNPSDEEKHAWLSEVHNPFVGHMGFHRSMKNLKRKGHMWYKMGADTHTITTENFPTEIFQSCHVNTPAGPAPFQFIIF